MKTVVLRPDSKGRISLGKYAVGVSSFILQVDAQNHLVLEPQVEIPAREKWLYDNPIAYQSLQKGLKEAELGITKKRGSFSRYAEEIIE